MGITPANKRTHEENVINGRKGGLKAAENRRKLIKHNSVTYSDLIAIDADLETALYWLDKITSGRFNYDYYNGDVQTAQKSIKRVVTNINRRRSQYIYYDPGKDPTDTPAHMS